MPVNEFRRRLGYGLRSAHLASIQHFARTVTRGEITPLQFSILLCIHQQPGINPTEIARAVGVKRANITVMLRDLEKRRFVRQVQANDDRRFLGREITAAGKRKLMQWLKLADLHEQRIVEIIGASKSDRFLSTLLRIVDELNDLTLD